MSGDGSGRRSLARRIHAVLLGLLGVVLVLALVSDASRTSTKLFIALFFALNLIAFRRHYRDGAGDDQRDPPRDAGDRAPR